MPDAPDGPEPGGIVGVVAPAGAPAPVVLGYDDGPEPGGTDRVLAELQRAGVTATFFVLLTRVRRHPGLLAETVDAGHDVALHGADHVRPTDLDPRVLADRLRGAKEALEDAVQVPVRWYRPPYGAQSPRTWQAAVDLGLTPVLWSLHLDDWRAGTDEQRLSGLRAAAGAGHVVLAHDGFAGLDDGVDDGPAPQLDRGLLTRRLLAACAEKGWHPLSLADAVAAGHELVRRPWPLPAGPVPGLRADPRPTPRPR